MKKIIMMLVFLTGMISLIGCNEENKGDYTPGIYYAVDPQTQVSAYINVNSDGRIDNVLFDKPYGKTTMNMLGDDYELPSGHSWKDEARFLASYLVLDQGWGNIKMVIADISGKNSTNVPDHFSEIDYSSSPENLAYFTMPLDGFVLAWNLAIADASEAGTGVVDSFPTSTAWTQANQPPFSYTDGIYYGADEDHGYIVRVVIENGFIVDVVFDAITAVDTRIVWNDNGTPDDETDDIPSVEIVSMSTKQAFQDQLVLISGTPWYVEERLLSAAIIEKQAWVSDWAFYETNGHEYFDFNDTVTVDAVAGVTMSVEGFHLTFQEAISKAIQD